jgi:hypothetical protein
MSGGFGAGSDIRLGGGCLGGTPLYHGLQFDTGSPRGGPAPARSHSANFVNMNTLYENHNLILTDKAFYIVPARDNIAIGSSYEAVPSCTSLGNDVPEPGVIITGATPHPFTTSKSRREYSSGFYDVVHPQDGCANAYADAVNKNGQNGIGLCGCGFRRIHVMINGHMQTGIIDSGAGNAMISSEQARRLGLDLGTKGFGSVKTTMLPNPVPVNMWWHVVDDGLDNLMAIPAKIITRRLTVVITRDFTIFISLNKLQGGIHIRTPTPTLTFNCASNQILQGDILEGRWSPKSLSLSSRLANAYHY